MKDPRFFIFSKINMFMLLNCFLIFIKIESLPYFQTLPAINNRYYIVFSKGIIFLNNFYNNFDWKHEFLEDEIITNENESEMVFLKNYNDNIELGVLIVKDYVYGLLLTGSIFCNKKLDEINGALSVVVPIKCNDSLCYYVIALKNSNNKLVLNLYENDSYSVGQICKTQLFISKEFNILVSSDNINCHYKTSFICFYESDSNKIIASYFDVDINNKTIESSSSYPKEIDGSRIIKSIMSPNATKYYICYTKNNNNGDCLIFDLITNQWENPVNYLNNCLLKISSLNIKFFDNLNYILLSCFQSDLSIQIVKFNNDFEIIDDEQNGIFYVNESLVNECGEYSLSSLVNDTDQNIIKIFCNCNYTAQKLEITKKKNELPSTIIETESIKNELPSNTSETANFTIPMQPSYWTIIYFNNSYSYYLTPSNLFSSINDFEIGKNYLIYGNDYIIKLNPTNSTEYKKNFSHIFFSVCEDKLRKYHNISNSSLLTLFHMEIFNNNSISLTNQIEYAIFDDLQNMLNLSICSNEKIKIFYDIVNSSMLNIPIISHFSDIGVDIFNIKDKFFNDICFPYSERDSDIILEDRIKDIYQNYSLCEANCEYENIDLENMQIVCNCFVKKEMKVEKEEPKYNKIIFDILKDSTFWVIKCYNLVFNLNKKNNIGFWIFLILFLLHIPFIIHYIIYQDKTIKNKIKIELGNNNKIANPLYKKGINKKKINIKRKIKNKIKQIAYIENQKTIIISGDKINADSSTAKLHGLNAKKIVLPGRKKPKSFIFKNKKIYKIKKVTNKHLNLKNHNLITMNNNNSIDNENKSIIKKNNNCIFNIIQIPEDNIILKYNLYYNIYFDALKYEKRSFCQIFLSMIFLKEKIINTFFFNSPFEIKSLHICLLIFIYSCNFCLNTLFYFSDKISEKYHYKGNDIYIYTLINNLSISIMSTLLSSAIVSLLCFLITSKNEIQNVIIGKKRLKENKKRNINKRRKKAKENYFLILSKILNTLKIKIFFFIIIELLLLLFFFYFTTAFCEVYKRTQIAWIIDCSISFIMSILIEILISFIITILYILSIKNKIRCLYRIVGLFL